MKNILLKKFVLLLTFGFLGLFLFLMAGSLNKAEAAPGTYTVYFDVCENNSGTNWGTQYRVRLASGTYTAYVQVYTTPGGDATACAATYGPMEGGVLASQTVSNID